METLNLLGTSGMVLQRRLRREEEFAGEGSEQVESSVPPTKNTTPSRKPTKSDSKMFYDVLRFNS